ncbi:MAG: bifunctional metallophosphatase/5'-nucleotidase [Deltaproteobacteria bacterium]|nr:MAG: bifunctional metallophosphatase/5'-nucleotidase [Deltaproteobacteria bacterium]
MARSLPILSAAAALVAACTVARDRPDLVGQDVRITIVHTADIHSRLFPYTLTPNRFDEGYGLLPENGPFGGIARIATLVKEQRERAARSLWLDSGDVFQGAPVFNLFRGEVEVRALSRAGLDAAVLGNHEFDLGSRNLYEQIDQWATYRSLAANYVFEEPNDPMEPWLRDVVQPYAIFDLDGVLVGVIGMGNWSSMTGIFEGGNSLGIRPIEDGQVVASYARLLRPVVDVVVVLSHLGLEEDEGLSAADIELDRNELLPLADVDVILGGHLHIVLNPPKVIRDQDGNEAILVHSGAFAKYVGRLDLVVRVGENNRDPADRSRITAFSYETIPVDSTVPDDVELTDLLQPYWQQLNAKIDLDGVFAYVDAPGGAKIVRNDPTGGDSQLGNLVARAMQTRSGVEAEFALTNSLGIRADFEPGALTVEQMFNVFPFENSITVMYLSGAEVKEMLDFNARKSASRGCRSQAQVAGIWHDMVCRSPDCPNGCAKNIFLGENCRNGNPDGPIDETKCAPLELGALYRVAVNDFIARGGSGFDVLERNTAKIDTGISLRDALTDFLRRQPACTDPAVIAEHGAIACIDETVEPHDGRIRPVFE